MYVLSPTFTYAFRYRCMQNAFSYFISWRHSAWFLRVNTYKARRSRKYRWFSSRCIKTCLVQDYLPQALLNTYFLWIQGNLGHYDQNGGFRALLFCCHTLSPYLVHLLRQAVLFQGSNFHLCTENKNINYSHIIVSGYLFHNH